MADGFDFNTGYLECVQRISTATRGARVGTTRVAACPAWTVRDLVGHLAGLAEDWIEGNLDGYAGDAWTSAQIRRHRTAGLVELLDLWASLARGLVALPDHPDLGPPARWAFGDALVHEADVAESLGSDQQPPIGAVSTHLSAGLSRWSPQLAKASIHLRVTSSEGRTWEVGADPGTTTLTVTASAYNLWRAVYGRRTRTAFAALTWSEDPAVVLAVGLPYPFVFPAL